MLLIFSPINTFLCSLPWLVKTPRSILADKYFLSNYVGIQSTFFSISNILKQWKVWEDLFTNKRSIYKQKPLLSMMGWRWEEMKGSNGTQSIELELPSKQACPPLQLRRTKDIWLFPDFRDEPLNPDLTLWNLKIHHLHKPQHTFPKIC